jgi:hypothetical protein
MGHRAFVLIGWLLTMTVLVACDSREAMVNRHFRQFTGTDVGLKVILIDQDWSNGVEAIGIVELSTPSGPMTVFYYLDTDQNIWHQFYKKRIYVPK